MKIHTTDWHYRLHRYVYGNGNHAINQVPKNLCPYFWKIMLALLIVPVSIPGLVIIWVILLLSKDDDPAVDPKDGFGPALGATLALAIITSLAGAFGAIVSLVLYGEDGTSALALWKLILMGYGVIAVVLGIVVLGAFIKEKFEDTYRNWDDRRKEKSDKWQRNAWGQFERVKNPKDGLFKSMFHATKDRMCPMIEIVDNGENNNE